MASFHDGRVDGSDPAVIESKGQPALRGGGRARLDDSTLQALRRKVTRYTATPRDLTNNLPK